MIKGDIVQFNEKHKWCGCIGYVKEAKQCGDDYRIMVGVPIPQQGTAYIYEMLSEETIEVVGRARLMPKEETEDE